MGSLLLGAALGVAQQAAPIARTVPPALHQLDAVATPLPPPGVREVIATSRPPAPPSPQAIVPVAARQGPTPPAVPDDGLVRVPMPALRPPLEGSPRPSVEAPKVLVIPTSATGPQTASVTLERVAPAAAPPGKPLNYEIVVRNAGPAPALQVRVADQLPPSVRYLGSEPSALVQGTQLHWNLGTLGPNVERRLKVQVQPAGEGDVESSATVTFAASAGSRTRVVRAQLALVKKGPETAQVGDAVPFQLVVTNTGSGPAENVVLRDRLPPGLKHSAGDHVEADLGTLQPGESKTVTVQTTAVKAGRMVNEASAFATDTPEVTAQATIVITEATLTVRKTGPQEANPGAELDYRIDVTNTGSAPAAGVRLSDVLPEGLDFVSAGDGGKYDAASRTVGWDVGTLAPGQGRAVTVRVVAKGSGQLVNRATARAERGPEASAELTVHVEGVAALLLEVVDLEDPIEVGADTTYEIRIVNQGSSACTNLKVVAVVPDGMTLLSADGPSAQRTQGQQLTFEPVPRLAARAEALYHVKVRAKKAGDWHFQVYMSSDQLPNPVLEEESTTVYSD